MRAHSLFAPMLLLTALLIGCGKSSSPELEPVVEPGNLSLAPAEGERAASPLATAPSSAESPAAEPPGTLELPADFDPQREVPLEPVTPGSSLGPRGLEMPTLPDGVQAPGVQAPSANASESPANAAEVSLRAAEWDQIAQSISTTRRVTVVDFWSLACEPCLTEFPGLVAMHRDLGERVTCVSVNVDYDGRKTKPAESYRPRVQAFLQSVGATFPNFLSETASDEVFSAIGIGSIPAVLVFDASGKLVRTFSDVGADAGFTYSKNVLPFVKQLLDQPQSS